jgi:hypothetical protein
MASIVAPTVTDSDPHHADEAPVYISRQVSRYAAQTLSHKLIVQFYAGCLLLIEVSDTTARYDREI